MAGQTVILLSQHSRDLAHRLVDKAPDAAVVNVREGTRTPDQNAKLWAMLSDISRARPEGRSLRSEQWKAAFMSALGHEVQMINGLDGYPPFPDQHRSSRLSKSEMGDLLTFIQEYGDRHGVKWSAT